MTDTFTLRPEVVEAFKAQGQNAQEAIDTILAERFGYDKGSVVKQQAATGEVDNYAPASGYNDPAKTYPKQAATPEEVEADEKQTAKKHK
jgi:hypothetical protein